MYPSQRYEFVRDNNWCYNCLSSHGVRFCQVRIVCSVCSKKHHTLLHTGKPAVGEPVAATARGEVGVKGDNAGYRHSSAVEEHNSNTSRDLGMELFPEMMNSGGVINLVGSSVALETTLGFVVMGRVPVAKNIADICSFFTLMDDLPIEQTFD
ncbi:hypothetical protein HHI36_023819 [Cryptolaemus montrouzieri]|uniref:Peptidase aspartic putative domain-containing protein n=1 Tax=Cryptolaemus montrouzieri TaxID=559131 RepID=A0ABD2PI00_9CUCU